MGKFISEVRPALRNSYAAELCGVLSALLFILLYHTDTSPKFNINFALDCQAVIDLLHNPLEHASLANAAHEITYKISHLIYSDSIQLSTTKIKSHLDETKDWESLTYFKKLNVWCDRSAKDLIYEHWNENPSFPFLLKAPSIIHL